MRASCNAPEFIFRFSKVSPYNPASQAIQASQKPNPPLVQDSKPSAAAQQVPSPERTKALADKSAEPLIEQLRSKPNDAVLLAQIGNAYYDKQVFPTAIDFYQKSLAINPKDTAVRTDMATALFYSNDPARAIAEFDRALKDDPENSNARFNRGIVKWQAKMDVKGALEDWEMLLSETPSTIRQTRFGCTWSRPRNKPT